MDRCRSATGFGRVEVDLRLLGFLPPGPGVFVEAGANDGVTQSNSLLLEQRLGWSGLLIEPVPELAALCRARRPRAIVAEAALVSSDYVDDVISMTYANLGSVTQGARAGKDDDRAYARVAAALQTGVETYDLSVPARTLSGILDEHGIDRIDLLSLDVEGYELSALRGLDLARHRPDHILVEAWATDRPAISAHLAPYYEPIAELGRLSAEDAALLSAIGATEGAFSDVLFRAIARRDEPAHSRSSAAQMTH